MRVYWKVIFPLESGSALIFFSGKGLVETVSKVEKYCVGQTVWEYSSCFCMALMVKYSYSLWHVVSPLGQTTSENVSSAVVESNSWYSSTPLLPGLTIELLIFYGLYSALIDIKESISSSLFIFTYKVPIYLALIIY